MYRNEHAKLTDEQKRELVQQQIAEISDVLDCQKVSGKDFYKVIFPGRDITSPQNGVFWRKFPLFGKTENLPRGTTVYDIERNSKIVDYELHHVLAYGQGTKKEQIKKGHILFYVSFFINSCF